MAEFSDPLENLLHQQVSRRTLLRGAAAVGLGAVGAPAVLAACGSSTPATTTSTAPAVETGKLEVFEWAGYDLPSLWASAPKGSPTPYAADHPNNPPAYTFLVSDDQALDKVRAGFKPDLIHPCVGHVKDWVNGGLIEPFDTSLMPNFKDLYPDLTAGGVIDGKQYWIPWDWGYSSILYRSDMVQPQEQSWGLFWDQRYSGKISVWDGSDSVLVLAGLYLGIPADQVWHMNEDQLQQCKAALIKQKPLNRNYWTSETDMNNDFKAGNIWITYAWPNDWKAMKDGGLQVSYMDPKEGRLSWVCGFVMLKGTPRRKLCHDYVNAFLSAASCSNLSNAYAYGNSNATVTNIPPDLATVGLTSTDALKKAHREAFIPNRRRYDQIWSEVKAS